MAEAKTKSGGSRRSSASRPSGPHNRSGANGAGRSRKNGSSTSRTASKKASSGARKAKAVAEKQTNQTRESTSSKVPALAGGAVLAGLAGVVALSLNGRGKGLPSLPGVGKKRSPLAPPGIPLPHVSKPTLPKLKGDSGKATRKALGATTKALGRTATEIGKAGYRAGELAAEVRRVREQASQKT